MPRILIYSQRNIYEREVWRCPFHEFEGVVREIDAVDLLAPVPGKWFPRRKRLAMSAGKVFKAPLNPGLPMVQLKKDYDLFLAVCEKPSELLHVNTVKDWKKRCKTTICWLTEFYIKQIPIYRSSLEVLSQFDHVLFMTANSEPFSRMVPGHCGYLSGAVDALFFCPFPNPPVRSIDVFSLGRRSEETHRALLRYAREQRLFYIYDTISDLHAYDLHQHRELVANKAKRSRYFIANPGKINHPEETGGQSEFGHRYFEGAAAGAIIVGERPQNREFERIFHWKDAVIDLPFGSDRIGPIMDELNAQPERQAAIRRTNMVQSLLNFDWVYRWEAILKIAGLAPLPQLHERKARLQQLAEHVQNAEIAP